MLSLQIDDNLYFLFLCVSFLHSSYLNLNFRKSICEKLFNDFSSKSSTQDLGCLYVDNIDFFIKDEIFRRDISYITLWCRYFGIRLLRSIAISESSRNRKRFRYPLSKTSLPKLHEG